MLIELRLHVVRIRSIASATAAATVALLFYAPSRKPVSRIDSGHANVGVRRRFHRKTVPKVLEQHFRYRFSLRADRFCEQKQHHRRKGVPFFGRRNWGWDGGWISVWIEVGLVKNKYCTVVVSVLVCGSMLNTVSRLYRFFLFFLSISAQSILRSVIV